MIRVFTFLIVFLCSIFSLKAQNVGIGKDNPAARLDVKGLTNDASSVALDVTNDSETVILRVRNDQRVGIGTTTLSETLNIGGNIRMVGANRSIGTFSNDNFFIRTNSSNRINVMSNGNVGIGINPNSAKFHIHDPSGASHFRITNAQSASDGGFSLGLSSDSEQNVSLWNHEQGGFRFISGSMLRMILERNTGNLGIGAFAPISKLHVSSNTFRDHLILDRTTSSMTKVFGITPSTTGTNSARLFFMNPNGSGANDILTLNDNGNVGIGFDNPSFALEVNGDVRISDLAGTGDRMVIANSTGVLTTEPVPSFTETDPSWSGNLNTLDDLGRTGRTGIGTTSPTSQLHVQTTGAGPIARFHAYGSSNPSVTIESESNAPGMGVLKLHQASDNTERVVLTANSNSFWHPDAGNVGIGQENPSGKLHISLDNSENTPVIVDKANGTGNGPLMEWYGFGATHRLQLLYTNDPFRYEFNTTENNRSIAFAPSQSLSLFLDAETQNVGIKTEEPNHSLDVGGDVRISDLAGTGDRMVIANSTGVLTTEPIPSFSETDPSWTGNLNTTDDLGREGRTGIGTTNPSRNLEVVGNNAGSEVILLQIRNNNTTAGTGSTLRFTNSTNNTYNGGAEIASIRTNTPSAGSNDLIFKTSTGTTMSEKMRIKNDGNIGIGTDNPNHLLDIEGDVRISDLSGGGDRMVVTNDLGVLSAQSIPSFTESDPTWSGNTNTTDNIGRTGNVGIGTTFPNSRLHVRGASGSVPFRVQVVGSSKLTVAANGGVSIGVFDDNPPADGLKVGGLSGTGDRMVIAEADGTLNTQPIPSGGGGSSNWINSGDDIYYDNGSVLVSNFSDTDIQASLVAGNNDDVMDGNRINLTANFLADFRRTDWSNSTGNGIKFTQGNTNTYTGTAAIVAERTGTWSQGKLHFAVNDAGSSGKTDIPILMTLDGPGNEVEVFGSHSVSGTKNFKIQHPQNQDMWLYHAAVESDEVLNKYSGNIKTNSNGIAKVELPEYIKLVNTDFRYQLTVIGTFAQAIIKKEFNGEYFIIETNEPNIKVSWELTAKRNDEFMKDNPFEAERLKAKFSEPDPAETRK